MNKVQLIENRLQLLTELETKPWMLAAAPTITGSFKSPHMGLVKEGYHSMDYRLPQGDSLRIIANHNKNTVQLLLFTYDSEKIKALPGERSSSLVADSIQQLNRYILRSNSYPKPRSPEQFKKHRLAQTCIQQLEPLLKDERKLSSTNWDGQENLRKKLITILEACRDANFLIATRNPVVSEGTLNEMIYEARKKAQNYNFNRSYAVSRQDQLDFKKYQSSEEGKKPYFIWDSELHIGNDEQGLDDSLRAITDLYKLKPAEALTNFPANRFKRFSVFLKKIWHNGQNWVDYLALKKKPLQLRNSEHYQSLSLTHVSKIHHLNGLEQKNYESLDSLVQAYIGEDITQKGLGASTLVNARRKLEKSAIGSWLSVSSTQILIKTSKGLCNLRFFKDQDAYYPLPSGQDLYTLSQMAKNHLYWPQRFYLGLKTSFYRIPAFFKHLYLAIHSYLVLNLLGDFKKHIHQNHPQAALETPPITVTKPTPPSYLIALEEVLKKQNLLENNQTVEEFVKAYFSNKNYVVAQAHHRPSPRAYDNPLHRILGVVRYLLSYFVDSSEKNPLVGTLALAAYGYGCGAILAPQAMTDLLIKLHLNGLISGIKPTQWFGQWMSHGQNYEAVSAAVTYWQGIITAGSLDQFFTDAITLVKEKPAEVVLLSALALSLGQGLCEVLPSLQKEMGVFPYINYAFIGGKIEGALYDTVQHPGDDWLLGTIKWFLKCSQTFLKIILGPFIESYYYGIKKGFPSGLKKSFFLVVKSLKQSIAALIDLSLSLLSMPLLEFSALYIHVPFRGCSKFLAKSLSILGNWRQIGSIFSNFATRPTKWEYLTGFRLSPLYGFFSWGDYAKNFWANAIINYGVFILFLPWSLFKNCILLPVLDSLSLSVRVLLSTINISSRLIACSIGATLTLGGELWDPTLGQLFHYSAIGCMYLSNKIDNFAGAIKRSLLAYLQIGRAQIYNWGFEEESRTSATVADSDYIQENFPSMAEITSSETFASIQGSLPKNSPPTHSTEKASSDKHYKPILSSYASENATTPSLGPTWKFS